MRLTLFLALCATGCGDGTSTSELRIPTREDFSVVSSRLEARCGTLDCHGGPARNLRIYGTYGLRLDGADVTGGDDTTEDEIAATFEALVSIEPETLSRVVAERGAGLERWIVYSKGGGLEAHTGGSRLPAGAPAERCVASWLGGSVDVELCAADVFGPEPLPGEAF